MRFRSAAIAIASLSLIACNTNLRFGDPSPAVVQQHNDWGNVYENVETNPYAPLSGNQKTFSPPKEEIKSQEQIKIVQPKKLKQEQLAQPAPISTAEPEINTPPVISNWKPNEALIIRGTELLGGLQKELGKKPTLEQMQKRLQTHMGLSVAQSQQLIVALGM